jgi:hypothetical protein
MGGPAIVIGEKCPYCTKFRAPSEIIHWPGGVTICVDCEWRHIQALEALSTGEFHGECSECGKTAEQLGPENLQMAVHFEQGRYRAMCLDCDKTYTPKRKELYARTKFGRALGLDK